MLEGVKWKDLEEGMAANNSSMALDVMKMCTRNKIFIQRSSANGEQAWETPH